jgi:phosphoglycerol transferase
MLGGSLVTAALAAGLLTIVLNLWRVSLRVPLGYVGDAIWYQMIIKGLDEGHWYYTNDRLGFPYGLEMYDFPTGDHFQLLIYKVIGTIVGGDPALTLNIGYLGGFMAASVIAYLVLYQLNVRPAISVASGVLFAFLPYHFVRGPYHLFLSGYFMIPLAVLIILRQYDRPAFLIPDSSDSLAHHWSWRDRWGWLALTSLIVIGTTGFYYAIFTGLFLIATMVFRFFGERNRTAALSTLLLCSVLGLVILADLAPTFIYQSIRGVNEQAVNRTYESIEVYALKPIQLLLPIPNHRIEQLRSPIAKVLEAGGTSEGAQGLGLVGAIGIMIVVIRTLALIGISTIQGPHSRTLDRLGVLTVGAILGASVGGFAAGFGVIGLTEIRAWNRISVFVGFFALAVVALAMDAWTRRRNLNIVAVVAIAAVTIAIGVLDQTGAASQGADDARAASWESDRAFIQAIESGIEPGSAVYQIPYMPYPETSAPNLMVDYDHLRGFLHSETLSWSYAAMKGRVPEWQPRVNSLGANRMLRAIILMGFDGLYIDRLGYADGATALESEVARVSGIAPLTSNDGRLLFFNLETLADQVRTETSASTVAGVTSALRMAPVQVTFGEGFYAAETDGVTSWSWASQNAQLVLVNPSEVSRSVIMDMDLRTGYESPAEVAVALGGNRKTASVSNSTGHIRMALDLPPGSTVVSFETDAAKVETPGDPRNLHVQVLNFIADDASWLQFIESDDPSSVSPSTRIQSLRLGAG